MNVKLHTLSICYTYKIILSQLSVLKKVGKSHTFCGHMMSDVINACKENVTCSLLVKRSFDYDR